MSVRARVDANLRERAAMPHPWKDIGYIEGDAGVVFTPDEPQYAHVKVIVTTGDTEVVYDMPKVEWFAVETDRDPAVKLSFTMRPQSTGDRVIMTVETRKIHT